MKVFAETKQGKDGAVYSVRYLLESDELQGLQTAGIIGDVAEIVGMQKIADLVMAGFEKQVYTANGGFSQ